MSGAPEFRPTYAVIDTSAFARNIDTVTSIFDQAGIPYDKQRPGTDWDIKEGSLVGYSLVVVPGYLEGGILRLAVDHERNQVLDEVSGVQVDRVVAFRDDLR